jgi:hypothetical protein
MLSILHGGEGVAPPVRRFCLLRNRAICASSSSVASLRIIATQGGRSILGQYARELRTQLTLEPNKAARRRFETREAQELQLDWSPYLVELGGCRAPVAGLCGRQR